VVGSSSSETYTITNTGTAGLSVGSLWVSGTNAGDFKVTTQPGTWVLPGQTTTFTVQFTPTATGARSATINFYENEGGSANTLFTFAVSGVATQASTSAATKVSGTTSTALALGVQENGASQATTATQTNVVSDAAPASGTWAAVAKTSTTAAVSPKVSTTASTTLASQTTKNRATDSAVSDFDLAGLYV
jgi:hypothetical protein